MTTAYLEHFTRLRTDSSRSRWPATTYHRAPHKPLLLLAVMDLIAEGTVSSNLIEITPDLGELFTLYWARVMPPDQRGNLALPFFHLKSDGFWHLIPQPGKKAIVEGSDQIKSVHRLRELVIGARLDEGLYQLLRNKSSREQLRALLIEKYFSPELHSGLMEQGIINLEAYSYSQNLLEQARKQKDSETLSIGQAVRLAARDQGFRRAVVTAYDHRCAICGVRMLTADGHTVVDAAHIKPWSVSFNDNPRNGMALCKLCHWSFDEGMISVSAKYIVVTSPQLSINHNIPGHIITFASRKIIGPKEEKLWPDLDALSWHRQYVFRKR
ncbi:MAG: HNH endonuclease [Acidobacteria bacterium]|nr:HNH endonuclease [Acidobacteriota bacterium]